MIKKIISIIFGQINKIIVSNNENVLYNQPWCCEKSSFKQLSIESRLQVLAK